jgi:hypothetical protein
MVATDRQTPTPLVSASAAVPSARSSSENLPGSPANPRTMTRLLSLAGERGNLYAQPSPLAQEAIIAAYHLPAGEAGVRGNRDDIHHLRAALRSHLLALSTPGLRALPNLEVCVLQTVTITAAGRAWLIAHRVPGVSAQLTPLDHSPHAAVYPTWDSASWTGSSRLRS